MPSGNKVRRGRSAGHADDTAAAPSPAPPPSEAASVTLPSTAPDPATTPGASVSTTTDGSWSDVTAGSPHSRRSPTGGNNIISANNNNNIISTTGTDAPRHNNEVASIFPYTLIYPTTTPDGGNHRLAPVLPILMLRLGGNIRNPPH